MQKTNLKNEYLEKIALVNDQLCYFQFADEIVRQEIENKGIVDQSRLTTEIFPSNKLSKRIQVKFSDLELFRNKAKETASGISLSLGVEHFLNYLDAIQNLKIEISNTSPSHEKFNSPEEQIKNNCKEWGIDDIDSAILEQLNISD